MNQKQNYGPNPIAVRETDWYKMEKVTK